MARDMHHHHRSYSTVTENRIEHQAATDEYIKILRDMETKAREQMIKLIPVVNQRLKAALIIEESGMVSLAGPRVLVKYMLNGEESTFVFRPSRFKAQDVNLQDFAAAFGRALAVAVINTALDELPHEHRVALLQAMGR